MTAPIPPPLRPEPPEGARLDEIRARLDALTGRLFEEHGDQLFSGGQRNHSITPDDFRLLMDVERELTRLANQADA